MRDSVLSFELPLQLSREQCDEYEQVAMTVVAQTMTQYAQYLQPPPAQRAFNARDWKLLKRRERLRIYEARDAQPTTAFQDAHPTRSGTAIERAADWSPKTKVCCVGSLHGSVDDAMYGLVTPTETAMMMRSLVLQDPLSEHRTIHNIRFPTDDEPFSYAGIKWTVRAPQIAGLVRPRDMVYVDASGFREIFHNGQFERVGYAAFHSVDIPGLPDQTAEGFVRCRFSMCMLFRQEAPGVVDMFATMAIAMAGDVPRKINALNCTEALVLLSDLMDCALLKKLAWMQTARSQTARLSSEPPPVLNKTRQWFFRTMVPTCPQCSRELTGMRTLTMCEICETSVCRRCITTRRLVRGRTREELVVKSVSICKGCISTAIRMDHARELAVYEFVRPFDRARQDRKLESLNQLTTASTISSLSSSSSSSDDEEPDIHLFTAEDVGEKHSIVEEISTTNQKQETPSTSPTSAISNYERMLWLQINELRIQAEQTYRMAKRQTLVVQQQQREMSSRNVCSVGQEEMK